VWLNVPRINFKPPSSEYSPIFYAEESKDPVHVYPNDYLVGYDQNDDENVHGPAIDIFHVVARNPFGECQTM